MTLISGAPVIRTNRNDSQTTTVESGSMVLQVKKDDTTISIHCNSTDTIIELKRKLEPKVNVPPSQQRLVFAGKQLDDGRLLSDYNIQRGSSLVLIVRSDVVGSESSSSEHVYRMGDQDSLSHYYYSPVNVKRGQSALVTFHVSQF